MYERTAEKRPLGAISRMGIVAGIHAAVLYAIATALVITKDAPPDAMTGTLIDEPEEIIEPVPATQPNLQTTDLYVPRPADPTFETDAELPPDVIQPQAQPDDGAIDPRGSADPMPVIQGVRHDPRRPLTQPQYPPAEIRAGNEGNADVEVYVLPNGRVGDARIARSTGHARLDLAAIEEAKRNWRLLPATRDGVAIPQWHRVRVVFRITNR